VKLTDEQRQQIAAKMDEFPEVMWDRAAGGGEYGVAYGWIDRDDGRNDFLVLQWWQPQHADARLDFGMTTSSARLSEEFTRRIDPGLEHVPCERVEDELPAVRRKIIL
jgi:hypothetical protein